MNADLAMDKFFDWYKSKERNDLELAYKDYNIRQYYISILEDY